VLAPDTPQQKENNMSTITRTGNLARTPELRHDDKGRPYTFARVIVTDRVRGENGEWEDGGTIGYDVAVNGSEAEALVATAEASGNIRVLFTGDYRTRLYTPEGGEPRIVHEVRNATVAISLRGQSVTVEKRGSAADDDSDSDRPF
jgi:single-strand DNA-binding protein